MNILYAITLLLSSMFTMQGSAAGYTVTWVNPTENTDGTPLTDHKDSLLWCLKAFQADGRSPTTYGNPTIHLPSVTRFVKDWAGPGQWKCKMRARNERLVESADSTEVFFTLLDPDGDGNAHTAVNITLVVPGIPNVTVECPVPAPVECPVLTPVPAPVECRSNALSVTRKGFYTISGPDGVWLTKPDGTTRRLTTQDEAYEWITKDGRTGAFFINPPPYEVRFE